MSTAQSTPVDYLLGEIARLRAENRRLDRKVRWLEHSRAMWRKHARAAEWGLRQRGR